MLHLLPSFGTSPVKSQGDHCVTVQQVGFFNRVGAVSSSSESVSRDQFRQLLGGIPTSRDRVLFLESYLGISLTDDKIEGLS